MPHISRKITRKETFDVVHGVTRRIARMALLGLVSVGLLAGCTTQIGDYVAASTISKDGFVRDADAIQRLTGQEVKLWGYVDHANLYGDEGAQLILGEWWSGAGPDVDTWRFNLKAGAGDAAGHSFAVYVPNDPGRDAVLAAFVADARARRPTRVFVTGRLSTFDAPTNTAALAGLWLEVVSSKDILLAPLPSAD